MCELRVQPPWLLLFDAGRLRLSQQSTPRLNMCGRPQCAARVAKYCGPKACALPRPPPVSAKPRARRPFQTIRLRRIFKTLKYRELSMRIDSCRGSVGMRRTGFRDRFLTLSQSQKCGRPCQTLLKPKGISTLIRAVREFALVKWRRERAWRATLFRSKSLILLSYKIGRSSNPASESKYSGNPQPPSVAPAVITLLQIGCALAAMRQGGKFKTSELMLRGTNQ